MVSNAPLVIFRFVFGLLMLLECWGAIATGWVGEVFVEPTLTFPLMGFEHLRVLSGPWMYGYFAAAGIAALGVMLGYRYRISAATLALLWTGAYLAQKSHYNNHYYLAVLVAWGMWAAPAHLRASLDVRHRRVGQQLAMPREVLWVFRAQLGIVFTYAAIAKLYPGWLNGDYLRVNLGSKGDRWPLGPLLVEPWFQSFVVYAAIVFDAVVVPGLLWRRCRVIALAGLVAFNLFNSVVFRIGIFPYMVLAWAVFFMEASSAERIVRWIPGLRDRAGASDARTVATTSNAAPMSGASWWRLSLVLFLVLQIALPLRHHLFRGDVTWTEEGHRMSWRMMLRTKTGMLALTAVDRDTGETWIVDQPKFLTPRQQVRVATQPEFLLQFVRAVEDYYKARGRTHIGLFARYSAVMVNGGEPSVLYDPDVDLVQARWRYFGRDPWVLDPR